MSGRNEIVKCTSFGVAMAALFVTALAVVSPRAQEDDWGVVDAPTRIAEEEGMVCTVEGVQVSKKDMEKGEKKVNIVFLLTQKPSVFFNYFDPKKKAVVFDFYDTRIGKSIMDSIHEPPIATSTVESYKLDLNKDVVGLKPDVREVVRVSLFTPDNFRYDVQEDVGVITMTYKLGVKAEKKSWWSRFF